jgi:hypothetical protein
MELDSAPAYSGFDCGPPGPAYNEVAFRHFFAIERRRAERACRALLLILVNLRMSPGPRPPLGPRLSAQIFSILGGCVREVDLVGWHREGTVAGAVIGLGNNAPPDARRLLTERIGKALTGQLPERPHHAAPCQGGAPRQEGEGLMALLAVQPAARNRRQHGHPVITERLFRDALVRERKRADRFEESFALVLISLACRPGQNSPMDRGG